jgi:phage-related protein
VTAKPVKVAFLADTADLRTNIDRAQSSFKDFGNDAENAGRRASASLDGTAEGADTVASKGAQAAGALAGLGDLVGGKFGSAMVVGGTGLQAFADAGDLVNASIEGGGKLMSKAVGTVQSLGRAETYATGAKKASAAAQRILNAAMKANTLGLIIVGITLLVAGFVLAYKKSETFRRIVNGALGAVKKIAQGVAGFFTNQIPKAFDKISGAASKVLGWIKGNWPKILAFLTGPIGIAVSLISRHWDKITNGAKDVWNYIKGLPGKIKDAFTGIFNGLAGTLEDAINSVLHLPLTIPRINTHIPGVGTVGGQTLIPALAQGGIVTSATLALIGEAGPEAVIPLKYLKQQKPTVVNVKIEAPVGADAYTIGETLKGYLDTYLNGVPA